MKGFVIEGLTEETQDAQHSVLRNDPLYPTIPTGSLGTERLRIERDRIHGIWKAIQTNQGLEAGSWTVKLLRLVGDTHNRLRVCEMPSFSVFRETTISVSVLVALSRRLATTEVTFHRNVSYGNVPIWVSGILAQGMQGQDFKAKRNLVLPVKDEASQVV